MTQKKLFTIFIALFTSLSLQGHTKSINAVELSDQFERVLTTMLHKIEPRISSGFTTSRIAQTIVEARNSFEPLAHEFVKLRFLPFTRVNKAFGNLNGTIATLDKKIGKNEKTLCPRHVRWLKTSVNNLKRCARAAVRKDASLYPIVDFTTLVSNYILPYFSLYIGTNVEKTIDSFFHRPIEFYARNWWWTMPLTVGTSIALWNGADALKRYLFPAVGVIGVTVPPRQERDPTIPPPPPGPLNFSSGRPSANDERYSTDGVIRNVVSSHFVRNPIERTFISQVRPQQADTFVRRATRAEQANRALHNQKNMYIVRARPGLNQKYPGPCPFHTLYNILCFFRHRNHDDRELQRALLNREAFAGMHLVWAKILNSEGWLDSGEIHQLIQAAVPELCQGGYIRQNINVVTYKTEDEAANEQGGRYSKTVLCQAGTETTHYNQRDLLTNHPFTSNIMRFRERGDAQFIYIFSGTDPNKELNGISFDWPRGYGPSSGAHTIAAKIEWEGRPMQSRVIITVTDSFRGIDNRFSRLIHWLYHRFVHQPLEEEDEAEGEMEPGEDEIDEEQAIE